MLDLRTMSATYEGGRAARRAFVATPSMHGFTRDIRGCDAYRLFLPPPVAAMMMVAQPWPKGYREWFRGWDEERMSELVQALEEPQTPDVT